MFLGRKVFVKHGEEWIEAEISFKDDQGFYVKDPSFPFFLWKNRGLSWKLGPSSSKHSGLRKERSVSEEVSIPINTKLWSDRTGSSPRPNSVGEWKFLVFNETGPNRICIVRTSTFECACKRILAFAKNHGYCRISLVPRNYVPRGIHAD